MSKCLEYIELISAYIDGQLEEDEKNMIEAHFKECEDCSSILKSYEIISEATSKSAVLAPESLKTSIMEKILSGEVEFAEDDSIATQSSSTISDEQAAQNLIKFKRVNNIFTKIIPIAASFIFVTLIAINLFRSLGKNTSSSSQDSVSLSVRDNVNQDESNAIGSLPTPLDNLGDDDSMLPQIPEVLDNFDELNELELDSDYFRQDDDRSVSTDTGAMSVPPGVGNAAQGIDDGIGDESEEQIANDSIDVLVDEYYEFDENSVDALGENDDIWWEPPTGLDLVDIEMNNDNIDMEVEDGFDPENADDDIVSAGAGEHLEAENEDDDDDFMIHNPAPGMFIEDDEDDWWYYQFEYDYDEEDGPRPFASITFPDNVYAYIEIYDELPELLKYYYPQRVMRNGDEYYEVSRQTAIELISQLSENNDVYIEMVNEDGIYAIVRLVG
ncbi:MAG: zf-HC2 domain-containing protein [Oscillospiraceae bacterium]|nr:zf-HC2 domain-containing protein [Oscillospiraceae bacterium]